MLSPTIRSSLRSSSRLVTRSGVPNRSSVFRNSGFRKYSTEAPKKSSNTLLWVALATAVAGGASWYFLRPEDAVKGVGTALKSGAQSAKVAANFVPTKGDYQKVRGCVGDSHANQRLCNVLVGVQQDCGDPGRCW